MICFHDNLTGGALVEILRVPLPPPHTHTHTHPIPGLLNYKRERERGVDRGETFLRFSHLIHSSWPFFFFFFALNFYVEFSSSDKKEKLNHFSLFCYCFITILLFAPAIVIAIYHYEMEEIFNLSEFTEIIDETHSRPSANQQTDHLAWEIRFLVLLL